MIDRKYTIQQLKAIDIACAVSMLREEIIQNLKQKKDVDTLVDAKLLWYRFDLSDNDPRLTDDFKKKISWGECRTFLVELKLELNKLNIKL